MGGVCGRRAAPGLNTGVGEIKKESVLKDDLMAAFSETLTPEFWDCFKTNRPCHRPGALAEVPQIMDLDAIMTALIHGSETGATLAFKRGEPCLRESIFMAYLDQATLSLTEAEKYFPELLDLCQGLAPQFGFVTSRLVLDPPNQRAPPMTTEGDVFFLCLWGEQQLTLIRPVQGLPMTAPRPTPQLQCTVRPGDVVFVPSGLECRVSPPAVAEGEASATEPMLNIILTVRTAEHSFGTSLTRYLNDLLREQSLSDETDKFFRTIPTRRDHKDRYPDAAQGGSRSSAEPKEQLEERLKTHATELTSKFNSKALRENFEKRMQQLRQEQRESAEKLQRNLSQATRPPHLLTSTSSIRVTRGISCLCAPGSSNAKFKRGPETLQLPIFPTASHTISDLTDGKAHVVDTLSCTDPVERLCVCQVLIFKDCVEPSDGIPEEEDEQGAYSGSFSS